MLRAMEIFHRTREKEGGEREIEREITPSLFSFFLFITLFQIERNVSAKHGSPHLFS